MRFKIKPFLKMFRITELVMFLLLVFSASSDQEPQCSKFHYEEKLLEKMIHMEIKMEEMTRRLHALETMDTQIQENLTKMTPRTSVQQTVAFSAVLTAQIRSASRDQVIVFETVRTNLGGGYNSDTGIFTAPVSGTYVFYSSVLTGNGAEIWLYISVRGNPTVRFYARATDNRHASGSQGLVQALTAGDTVSINNDSDGASIYGGIYTSFSGFLIN